MSDLKGCMAGGDDKGAALAKLKIEIFTSQLDKANPILTNISDAMYGNLSSSSFGIISHGLSPSNAPRYAIPHAPCNILHLVRMLIGGGWVLAIRYYDQFTGLRSEAGQAKTELEGATTDAARVFLTWA